MLKFQSIMSLLLLTIILPIGRYDLPTRTPLYVNNQHFVNVSIDKIQFLENTGDISGNGEFRLLILSSDTKGKSSGTFCPGTGPIIVKTGDTVKSPCLQVISFDEETVSEGVFLTIMALDEDKATLPKDISYELVSNKLGSALGSLVKNKTLKIASYSIPYAVPIEILVSLLTGKVKSWIEQADIVGAQGIYLSKNDNWSATGKAKTVTSSDGGIKITYTVSRSSTDGATQTGKSPTSTPHTSVAVPTRTPQVSSSGKSASISCANRLYFVRLRRSPGYNNKDDTADTVAEIPCGENVKILDGPTKKDGLNWYQISWSGLKGWVADYTSSGKLILIFE